MGIATTPNSPRQALSLEPQNWGQGFISTGGQTLDAGGRKAAAGFWQSHCGKGREG